jgi:mxaL protein
VKAARAAEAVDALRGAAGRAFRRARARLPMPQSDWPARALRATDRSRWQTLSLLAAALLLAATFLHPGLTLNRARFDHVIVLDVTQSMNVADRRLAGQPVSRLVFAKAALQQALTALPCGSKLGWAIFTEYRSYLLLTPVEVCANRAELRSTLAAIDGRMAWSGNSEIAKGLHSGLVVARELPDKPSLVFITDGQEAPPLSPNHRPSFDDKPGEVPGLIVGIGDIKPSPIPKTDPLGRPLGVWAADEVAQVDPRSRGRGGSVASEQMADDAAPAPTAGLGATPGSEHLSGLREAYLQLLAAENGLQFLNLREPQALTDALQAPALARPLEVRADARIACGALAFVLLLVPQGGGVGRRRLAGVGRRRG